MESKVVPKEQRIFVRKQYRELSKRYEFWDYLNKVFCMNQKRKCYYCGMKLEVSPKQYFLHGVRREWEVDHKVPIYLGGTNVDFNLCIACKPCNRLKKTDLLERNIETIGLSKKMKAKKIAQGKAYF